MSTLEKAVVLAATAHAGQIDKAGQPYILHVLRVMLRVSTPEERIAAVLHDVMEDCGITGAQLRAAGFSNIVIEAVEALTHGPALNDEEYLEAIRRVKSNPVARRVKRADLEDNLDIRRLPRLTEKDLRRLNRYKKAIEILDENAESV